MRRVRRRHSIRFSREWWSAKGRNAVIVRRGLLFHFLKVTTAAVPELREIRSDDSEWHIGAAVTLTEIEDKMGKEFPALGDMLRVFGSRQIRNRATMGGNLVTASPIGDSAPVLLALNAGVVLVSLRSGDHGSSASHLPSSISLLPSLCERTIPISEFFVAYRKTALQ